MISIADMRVLEDNAESDGVTKAMLMARAGAAFVKVLSKRYSLRGKSFLVLCYHGNNGGDGFVIARELASHSKVEVCFLGDESKLSPEALENYRKIPSGVRISTKLPTVKYDFMIDALLGTGSQGTIKEPMLSAVGLMNSAKSTVISVDIPTGDTKPNLTITFHDKKPGLTGAVAIADIGLHDNGIVGPGELRAAIPTRRLDAKKGDYGKVLLIGGSEDFAGAPALAIMALSALRGGADLVRVDAPEKVSWAINSFTPDVITRKLKGGHLSFEHLLEIKKDIDWADVILIGPGLGTHEDTIKLVHEIAKVAKPKVIDADAIKMISLDKLKNTILTPHRGEFQIIWKDAFKTSAPKQLNAASVKKLQEKIGNNVILLKGPEDHIISAEKYKRNMSGDVGMAVGGTGDVLAGLTAGILAMCKDAHLAASAAAYINGKAGELCKVEMHNSYIASDVVKKIPVVINKIG